MDSKRKINLVITLVGLIMFKSVEAAVMLDLKLNSSTQVLTKDANYYYLDTYINNCLARIESCQNGFTFSFYLNGSQQVSNADVMDTGYSNGRVILASSGGDSPYSYGGFYLHRVNVRDEKFIEFGVSVREQLFSTKLYVDDQYPMRLAFTWNKDSLASYVDGSLYKVNDKPVTRSFQSLNYNPFKTVRTLIPKADSSTILQAQFNDTQLDNTDPAVKGGKNDYYLGCFTPKTSKPTEMTIQSSPANLNDDCRAACSKSNKQVALIQNGQCSCLAKLVDLNSQLVAQQTTCAEGSFQAFAASHVIANNGEAKKVGLKLVPAKGAGELIEEGDPVGFSYTLADSNNYKVVFDFSNGQSYSVVGAGFVFTEFNSSGVGHVNVTATSLTDSSLSERTRFDFRISKRVDRTQMSAANLDIVQLAEKTIEVTVNINGGHPFQCVLNYGDPAAGQDLLNSTGRSNAFRRRFTYNNTGLYNVSVVCKGVSAYSTLVFLPAKYQYKQNENTYDLVNLREFILARTNIPAEIDLELPIAAASPALKFTVFDFQGGSETIDWIAPRRTANGNNIVIKVKSSFLRNLNGDNYIGIKCQNVNLASYLFSIEEPITIAPTMQLVDPNQVLKLNDPINFQITVQTVPNAFIRIDFSDGSVSMYHTSQLSAQDTVNGTYKFTVSKTFKKGIEFNIKISMANQVSRVEGSFYLFIDADLPELILNVPSEVNDFNQNILLKLSTGLQSPLNIPNIKITVDTKDPSSARVYKNYTFDSSNDFSLVLPFQYSGFGLFNIVVEVSNSRSTQELKATCRVGTNINDANGHIVSGHYSNVNEDVTFFVKINGGNGYEVQLNLGDDKSMVLPWSYVKSKGEITTSVPSNSVTPRTRFASNGIFMTYKYDKSGEYSPSINISNVFSSVYVTFCAKVVIAEAKEASGDVCSLKNNLELTVNENDELITTKPYTLGKAIANLFAVSYRNCNQSANVTDMSVYNSELQIYWIMNSLIYRDSELQEEVVSKYCFRKEAGNSFEIKANELLYGDFVIKVYVFNVNAPQNYVLLGNYVIKVGASPLTNGLQRPLSVELNWNERLDLDYYSKSIDPDALADKQKDMRFDFICVNDPLLNSELLKVTIQKAKENDFDGKELGYNLALNSEEYGVRLFEKNCMVNQWTPESGLEPPIKIDPETRQLRIEATGMILNFTTPKRPFVFQMILRKMNRVSVSKQVKVFLNISSMAVIIPSTNLDEMENQLAQLDNLVDKDPKKALGMLGNFADAINERSNANDNMTITNTTTAAVVSAETEKLTGLRGKMLGTVDKIVNAVDDPDSFLTAADMTGSVTSNPNQMPAGNQESGANVMDSMGEKLLSVGPESADMIGNVADSMLGTVGNVFGAAVSGTPTVELDLSAINLLEPENETEPEPLPAKIAAPLEFYAVDTEDFPEDKFEAQLDEEWEQEEVNIGVREKSSAIAKTSFNGISNAGGAMANNSNGTTVIQKKGMAIVAAKLNFNETDDNKNSSFGAGSGPTIKMPKLGGIIKDGVAPTSIASRMLVAGSNPFQSSDPTKNTKGSIVSMELTDENGNPIPVNNTDEPFVIQVPNPEPAKSYRSSVDLIGYTVYKLYLPTATSALVFVLKPDTPGDYFHVYMSRYTLDTPSDQKYPSEKYHDWAFTVPNNRSEDPATSELPFTAFISNNETKGNGTYYIAVKLAVLSEETKQFKKLHMNDTHEIQVNFTVRLFATACKYWHANTSEWLTDGCYVADTTDYQTTVCNCYHLTTFGGDMVVPPNTIDFGSVFSKFNIGDNPAVFATVVSVLGLYVFVALYARYKDKKDIIKWGATPLSDNLPTDNYFYLISVQTGFGRECGTKSKIGFVLSGENADSGVRKLTDDKRKAFKAGSICNFLMGVEEPLGPLTHIRIWHDNSGKGSNKSWFLNVVGVTDLQSNEKSNFVCNKWFGVEKEDGQVDRVIPVACRGDMTTFQHLFAQSIKKKFTDNHLWFSVFSRPTKSNFTRLQRISTCMSLLFCTMIANAMFYKADSPNSGKQAIEVGPIKFTMSQLFTSIVSTMIVVPVNLIIVTLFRKAKVVHKGILPMKTSTSVQPKQRHWRQNVQSIEFESSTTNFNGESTADMQDREAYENRGKSRFACLLDIFSKNKTVEYKRESKQDEMNRKRGRTLPHWVIWISWCICFVSTIVPAFFCILYSMQWGKERSNAWLTSIALSFFQSLLVIDPLKIMIVTSLITFIVRKPDAEAEDSPVDCGDPVVNAVVNRDEDYLHDNSANLSQVDLREILHQRRQKLHQLNPVDPEVLEKQRIERIKNIRFRAFMKEGAIYLAFLAIVLFLAHQGRTKSSNNVHVDLQRTFLESEIQVFTEIQSRDDFWNYMENVFLPGLYAPVWYNNKSLVWREKLTSVNRQNLRVGAARLRQLRVKDNTCRVHPRVTNIIEHCRTDYNWVDDDTKDYDKSGNWIPPKNVTVKKKGRKKTKKDCEHAWCYQGPLITKSVPIKGTYTTYKGGGYVQVLGRALPQSIEMAAVLKEKGWIDSLTRAVFFEFTFYNPNVNLFASCTFIVEFLSTGHATTYWSITVFSLYNYLGSMGIVVLVFQIAYVAFLIYFVVHAIFAIKEEKVAWFKSFWNIVDLVVIIGSFIAMGMYGMKTVFVNLAVKELHESELNGFVNFNTLGLWDEIYCAITAFIVFLSTLKFLKLLRHDKNVKMLNGAIVYALKDLASFAVQFMIFIFAFTQFGYLVFGDNVWTYRDFFTTLASMFRFALGSYEFPELMAANFTLGGIYFVGFIFIVMMGLMSMFCSILGEAYEKVKEEVAGQPVDNEIFSMIKSKVKKISKKHRFQEKMANLSKSIISINDETLNVMIKKGHDAYNSSKTSEKTVNYY